MKYGVRKPSIKKSVKARTTGKVKRQMKKAVNTSMSAGDVFRGIGSFFQLLFVLLQMVFWLACIIGIIALVVWIFKIF